MFSHSSTWLVASDRVASIASHVRGYHSSPSLPCFPIWRLSNLTLHSSSFFFLQMSDDDRLSLTTAVSDDEETATADPRAGSYGSSTYGSRSRSGAAAASFNCTGAVRKAGWVLVLRTILMFSSLLRLGTLRMPRSTAVTYEVRGWFLRTFHWKKTRGFDLDFFSYV